MDTQAQHPSDLFPSPSDPAEEQPGSQGRTGSGCAHDGKDGKHSPVPPHVITNMVTSPGKPSFGACDGAHLDLMSPSLLHLASSEDKNSKDIKKDSTRQGPQRLDKGTPLGFKIRGCASVLMLAALFVYELASFEWKDWRDRGEPHGANGFTG